MRFYLLKPGTDAGHKEYAAIAAMGLERQVLDGELKPAMYLKEKTPGQMVRTAKARFALPEPSFRTG